MKTKHIVAGILLMVMTAGVTAQNETAVQNRERVSVSFTKNKMKLLVTFASTIAGPCKEETSRNNDGSLRSIEQFKVEFIGCITQKLSVELLYGQVQSIVAYEAIERLERRIIELEFQQKMQ